MTDPGPQKGDTPRQQREGREQPEGRWRVASHKSQQHCDTQESENRKRDAARAGTGRGGKRTKVGSSVSGREAARPRLTLDSSAQGGAAGPGGRPSSSEELHSMRMRISKESAQETHLALATAPGPELTGGTALPMSHSTMPLTGGATATAHVSPAAAWQQENSFAAAS